MFDILIKNGTLVDGSGASAYSADLAVANGKIAEIGENIQGEAKLVLDGQGMIVAPGFIDIHTHSDVCCFVEGRRPESKLYQGITLEITGNCGRSHVPILPEKSKELVPYLAKNWQLPFDKVVLTDNDLAGYAEHVRRVPALTNLGVLIGHGTLRANVMGLGMEPAGEKEIKAMCDLLEQAMEQGAFGMSLGLIYPPSSYGNIAEFVALAKVIKKYDGILTVHMRNEGNKIFEAVDEMLTVAEQSGVHLQISHLKLMGKPQWGRAEELLGVIKAAQAKGINVTCDQYPYLATSTGLSAVIPKWAHAGGPEEMCKRLDAPTEQLLQETKAEIERRGGAHCVLVIGPCGIPEFDGKRLDEIAAAMELTSERAACRLLVIAGGGIGCCYFSLCEEDMLKIMEQDFIAIGSDGYAFTFDKKAQGNNPHPRSFGTFPRFFQTVREHKLMSLEKAVYKATGLSADILGLKDRGRLQTGMAADITVFDYGTIEDCSEYTDSLQKPKGIKAVIIDGRLALLEGEIANPAFGRVLLHSK